MTIDLRAPKLDVTPQQASGESVALVAKLQGPRRNGDIDLQLSRVEGNATALRIAALTLNVDARLEDDAIKGELTTPVTGNLEEKVFELIRTIRIDLRQLQGDSKI